MSRIRDLPTKDYYVLLGSLILLNIIYAASVYQVYIVNSAPVTVEFTVFDATVHYWPDIGMNQTQILTWGTGKYYFVGTWDKQFLLDHTYRVTYVQQSGAKRPWQKLIVIAWEEVA